MRIDPKVEKPARALLGHAIRAEWDEYANVIEDVGEERFLECLSLCLRISGYIAIDICEHKWPSDADLRDIAGRMSAVDLNLGLTEPAVYECLARCALGFEPLAAVFPDSQQAASVPVFATAALLVSYRRHGGDWWDYLEQIENALETAASLPESVFPAALLLSRRNRYLRTQAG
jgi:hypothetical protein